MSQKRQAPTTVPLAIGVIVPLAIGAIVPLAIWVIVPLAIGVIVPLAIGVISEKKNLHQCRFQLLSVCSQLRF